MHNEFLGKISVKLINVLLPVIALMMSLLPNSYRNPILDPVTFETLGYEDVNYLAQSIRDLGNWLPAIFVLLCGASIVMGVYCMFKETEKTLTWLTGVTALAMTVNFGLAILFEITNAGWFIAALMVAATALAAWREIQLEKKGRYTK